MNWIGNLVSLFVNEIDDLNVLQIVSILVGVANLYTGIFNNFFVINLSRGIDLSSEDNSVVFGHNFDSTFGVLILG